MRDGPSTGSLRLNFHSTATRCSYSYQTLADNNYSININNKKKEQQRTNKKKKNWIFLYSIFKDFESLVLRRLQQKHLASIERKLNVKFGVTIFFKIRLTVLLNIQQKLNCNLGWISSCQKCYPKFKLWLTKFTNNLYDYLKTKIEVKFLRKIVQNRMKLSINQWQPSER